MRIETPASFEQSLAPQDFVNAGNASVKLVGGIEDGGVGVGDLRGQSEQFAGIASELLFARARCETAVFVHTAQWPSKPPAIRMCCLPKSNGVSRSFRMLSSLPVYSAISCARPDSRQRATTSMRLIAIEGRDLDRHHVFDLDELPPEFVRQERGLRPRAASKNP